MSCRLFCAVVNRGSLQERQIFEPVTFRRPIYLFILVKSFVTDFYVCLAKKEKKFNYTVKIYMSLAGEHERSHLKYIFVEKTTFVHYCLSLHLSLCGSLQMKGGVQQQIWQQHKVGEVTDCGWHVFGHGCNSWINNM